MSQRDRNSLLALRRAVQTLDQDLRENSARCPICDKPTGGFVPVGETKRTVGICAGHPSDPHADRAGLVL